MRRRTVPFVLLIFIATLGFVFESSLPGQSPAPTVQENSAPAQFAYGGNAAQNPAAFIGNLIFIPVRIDQGKPLLFELNSSAAATSVDPGFAPTGLKFRWRRGFRDTKLCPHSSRCAVAHERTRRSRQRHASARKRASFTRELLERTFSIVS